MDHKIDRSTATLESSLARRKLYPSCSRRSDMITQICIWLSADNTTDPCVNHSVSMRGACDLTAVSIIIILISHVWFALFRASSQSSAHKAHPRENGKKRNEVNRSRVKETTSKLVISLFVCNSAPRAPTGFTSSTTKRVLKSTTLHTNRIRARQ